MSARFAPVFFVVAAGCLFWAGCNTGGSGGGNLVEVTERVQRGVTPGRRTIAFDSYDGDVTLQDTSGREASFTFVKRARAESREAARKLLDDIRIKERGGENEFTYQTTSSVSGRTSVDVEGSVPQGTRLRLRLRNGDVALSGLDGPLDVNDENGDIRIGGAAQETRAETRNGSIEVGMRRVPPEGEVRLRTANGDLELTLPGTTSADVEARTEAGEIDVGSLQFADRDLDRSGAGARFDGDLGDGASEVRLRTENGDITLREGTVRRLPDAAGASTGRDTTGRDSTGRDTTGLDSLYGPPATPGAPRDSARRGTTGLLGPPLPGQARPQQQPRTPQGRQGGQRPAPYTDAPPPLLRRPASQQRDTSGSSPTPTDSMGRSVPGLPSSLRHDTSQQR
jgi:predicted small secreted protein